METTIIFTPNTPTSLLDPEATSRHIQIIDMSGISALQDESRSPYKIEHPKVDLAPDDIHTMIWDTVVVAGNAEEKWWKFVNRDGIALAISGAENVIQGNKVQVAELHMIDPRRVGGVAAWWNMACESDFDAVGVSAGLNHGYLRMFFDGAEDGHDMREMILRNGDRPLIRIYGGRSKEEGPALVARIIQAADELVLCPCKQMFAFKNNPHCMVCIAAISAGRAGECVVCKRAGAWTKTSCCNQFLHSQCNNKVQRMMRKWECPNCHAFSLA